jgi:NAD(P)-dependent dehydrogenase (short-subunit alcohol dehydrogenase family)
MPEFKQTMTGKVAIVTGATSGIGEVTSLRLAEMGATLVMTGRDREKSDRIANEIRKKTGNTKVVYLVGDLSTQKDIRRLVDEFKSHFSRLDVLVNNAGAVFISRRESADGIEMTFGLNHLNYFLLTNLLLDTLVASAPARIVNVSSAAHQGARLNFADLENKKGYNGMRAYGQSKLDNLLFTYELARRLEGTGVTANAMHPGFVASNFAKNNLGILKPLISLIHIGAISPEEGAQSSLYLATSLEVEGVSGKYFIHKKAVTSSPASYDEEAARRLWEISEKLTGLSARALAGPLPPG